MKTKKLEDSDYEKLYINYDQDFFGEELPDDKVALHGRKRIDGREYWAEVKMPKGLVEASHELNFYKKQLNKKFEYLKTKLYGQAGDTETDRQ